MPLSDARTHPPQQLDSSPRPVEKMFKFSGIFTKLKQLARCGFSGTDCNFALISTHSAGYVQKNKANIRVRLKRLFSILARQACGTRDRDHDNDPLSVPLLAAGRNCRGRIASIPSEHGRRESP